jgi:hypothetical protein
MTFAGRKSTDRQRDGARAADPARDIAQRSAELIADLMDSALRVPGTRFTIGLDPLLGLLPGLGDTIASVIGSAILVLAHQLGVPRIVQVRMALNVLINGTVGIIPGVGDLFSFWFKSNLRNARLLRVHGTTDRRVSTAADWGFVVGLIVAVLTAMVLMAAAGVWLIRELWQVVR